VALAAATSRRATGSGVQSRSMTRMFVLRRLAVLLTALRGKLLLARDPLLDMVLPLSYRRQNQYHHLVTVRRNNGQRNHKRWPCV